MRNSLHRNPGVIHRKLGDCHVVIDDATFEQIEEFVYQMYSVRGERNVNAARLSIFSKNFEVTNVNENFMKGAINFDGSSIPPCASELRQQVFRARYIANIWCNASLKIPTALCPTNRGLERIICVPLVRRRASSAIRGHNYTARKIN